MIALSVNGHFNRLKIWLQVIAILEAGHPLPFTVKAANLDLPELQGEPVEIAKEKCRLAAQQVPHQQQSLLIITCQQ